MSQYRVKVLECHTEQVGDYPMIYGKGKEDKGALVYFQFDGLDLRRAKKVRKGVTLVLTDEDIIGMAEGYFVT